MVLGGGSSGGMDESSRSHSISSYDISGGSNHGGCWGSSMYIGTIAVSHSETTILNEYIGLYFYTFYV